MSIIAPTTAENMKNRIHWACWSDIRNVSPRPRVFPSKNFKIYFNRESSFWTSWINSFFSFLLTHIHTGARAHTAERVWSR